MCSVTLLIVALSIVPRSSEQGEKDRLQLHVVTENGSQC